jgi:hypothetical protein
MANAPRTLTLFCWILDRSQSPFHVDIDDSRTISHLKDAILDKKHTTLGNIEADLLTLYKVGCASTFSYTALLILFQQGSIQITPTLKNDLSERHYNDGDKLLEWRLLQDVFPEPVAGTLHVVIKAPDIGECELLVAS